jgi:hypothetical protein
LPRNAEFLGEGRAYVCDGLHIGYCSALVILWRADAVIKSGGTIHE